MSAFDSMQGGNGGNPATNEGNVRTRYAGEIGGFLRPYKAGNRISAAEAAPASMKGDCMAVGRSTKAEIVVRTPNGITGYKLRVGRWVVGDKWQASGDTVTSQELDGFVVDQEIDVTGGANGELKTFTWDTRGDRVGAYVTDLVGAVAAGESFMYWIRGIGG